MSNLKDAITRVTLGDIRTLTRTKRDDWHRYQKRDRKLHRVMLSNMSVIPGLHKNIFSLMRALQKCFQVKLEGKTLIIKVNYTDICFDEKMENNSVKGFIFTTKFYKSAKNAEFLYPNKQNPEGNANVQLEGTASKNREKTATKKIAARKIHKNKLHAKLGHTRKDRMRATVKRLHYSIKGTLEVCKGCAMSKIKHKSLL